MADRDDSEIPVPPTVEPQESPEPLPSTEGPTPEGEIGPGSILFGRRRVIRKLGAGGMGDVWLVRLDDLGCERALKRIVSGVAADPHARARFRAEARTMAAISHPNVVVLHDASLGEGGQAAFIEMEYVRGRGLDRLMGTGSAMPLDWIGRVVRQLCDALEAVHARGIVHRDLKPSNLMLLDERPPGREWLKVLDFGIAKALRADAEDRTITRGFIGSYPYAAPEQIEGAAGVASDLYSTGVLLYQMLTGHRPFTGRMTRVIHDHVHTDPPPFAAVRPDLAIPPAVEALVRRCLAKSPSDRPATAAELGESLLAAIRAEAPSIAVAVPETLDLDAPRDRSRTSPLLRRQARIVALAVALASVAGVGTLVDRIDRRPAGAGSPPVALAPPIVETPGSTPPPPASEPVGPDLPPPPAAEPVGPPVLPEGPVVGPAAEPVAGPPPPAPGPVIDPAVAPASTPPQPGPAAPTLVAAVPADPSAATRPAPKPPAEPRSRVRNKLGMLLAHVPQPDPTSGSFYLDVHEVTQGVYLRVVGINPSVLQDSDALPVTNVSWLDALKFCNALSVQDGREPFYDVGVDEILVLGGDGYRLPTAAEWQFACCQGATRLYSSGNDISGLGQVAWYLGNSRPLGDGVRDIANIPVPHEVGRKSANRLGLLDMHGNVAEWCWDAPGRDRAIRVVKGGCFEDEASNLRATRAYGEPWETRDLRIGFRVARDASAGDRTPAGRPLAVERFRVP